MFTNLFNKSMKIGLIIFSLIAFSAPSIAAKAVREANIDKPFGERSIMSDDAIRERTAPDAKVCLAGDDSCGGAALASAGGAAAGPRTGQQVYEAFCMACHASGVGGAPKTGDKAAWSGRANLATAIKGIGIMPAKGGCADCSDDELQAAIDFMSK